jgi:hypothetical protein
VKLFHVSDRAGLTEFIPRPATLNAEVGPFVWAVDERHLPNYLVPRDCPRVTFGASPHTTDADRLRFGLRNQTRIVVVEAAWLKRIASCELYLYLMPAERFVLHDTSAGYWVASEPVVAVGVDVVSDVASAIADLGGELRVVKRLWGLHDAIAASTLEFSMIRMRDAARD